MARVKVHTPCMRPIAECGCPPDDDDEPQAPDGDQGSGEA